VDRLHPEQAKFSLWQFWFKIRGVRAIALAPLFLGFLRKLKEGKYIMSNNQIESLSYEEITRIIGSLYLESERRQRSLQDQATAVIEELKQKISALETENDLIKSSMTDLATDQIHPDVLGDTEKKEASNGTVSEGLSSE
tara:strand:- start:3113 stop:3532 length:420 start_codon:yes stop_codon:yes gene_type:complete